MTYLGIGLIVGIIMGLTGAGGALISIPLFITLLNTTLKEATILSLIAVILGTSINLLDQFSKVEKNIALTLSFSGIIANYGTLFLKPLTPDYVVAGLLVIIAIYSLFTVWNKSDNTKNDTQIANAILKALAAGTLIGILTTLTGLGGGVILVPILIKVFGKTYTEALPTSLGTILLISMSSFILQSEKAFKLISLYQLGYLAAGVLIAFLFLKLLVKNVSKSRIEDIRKIVFSAVTIYSTISVIIKVL